MSENFEQKGRNDGCAAALSLVHLDKMSEELRRLYVTFGRQILSSFMTVESRKMRDEGAIQADVAMYVGTVMTTYDEIAASRLETAGSGALN